MTPASPSPLDPALGQPANCGASTDRPRFRLAAQSIGAWLIFGVIAVLGVAADLYTKSYAFDALGAPEANNQRVVLPDVLIFKTTLNHGAVFGVGQNHTLLFIMVSILALAFVLYVFATSSAAQKWLHVALGLILAGALGNLYDRALNGGMVRDFILMLPRYWPWIFNVADVMLCIGVPLLMLCWIFQRESRPVA